MHHAPCSNCFDGFRLSPFASRPRTQYATNMQPCAKHWCPQIQTHEEENTADAYICLFGCDAVASALNVQHTLTGTYTLYTANSIAIIFSRFFFSFHSRHTRTNHMKHLFIANSYFHIYILKLIHSISFHSNRHKNAIAFTGFCFARNTETGYFNLTVTRNDEWIRCEHLHSHVPFARLMMFTRHSFIGARPMRIGTFFFFFSYPLINHWEPSSFETTSQISRPGANLRQNGTIEFIVFC